MPNPPIKNQKSEINGLSIAALVLGIISIISGTLGIIIGLIGLILSIIQMKKSKNILVTIGLILNIVGIILGILFTIMIIFVFMTIDSTMNTLQDQMKEQEKCFQMKFEIKNIDLDSNTITINSSSRNLIDLDKIEIKVNGITKHEITSDKFGNSNIIKISFDVNSKDRITLVPILTNGVKCFIADSAIAI